MLVYTNGGKYIISYYNPCEDTDGEHNGHLVYRPNFYNNTLDNIQNDLVDIYPKQIHSGEGYVKVDGDYIEYEYHSILDVNDMLHVIRMHGGVPELYKNFYKVTTVNSKILCYIISTDRMILRMVNITDCVTMYDIHMCYTKHEKLYHESTRNVRTFDGKLHDICDKHIAIKLNDDMIELISCIDDRITVVYDPPKKSRKIATKKLLSYDEDEDDCIVVLTDIHHRVKCHDFECGILEYTYKGVLYVQGYSERDNSSIRLSFDMSKYNIKSHYYHYYNKEHPYHILLIIDGNNDAFLYKSNFEIFCKDISDFKHIGKIVGDYGVYVPYGCIAIIQHDKVLFADTQQTICGLVETDRIPHTGIVAVHGHTFNRYSWDRKIHRYLSKEKQLPIETFIMCNRQMGKLRIPYYVLCKIFTYIV